MKIEDFKDKHKGEEMIVICNGDGLKNIPFAFLESRPNFAINHFPRWVPWLRVDYWTMTDHINQEMLRHESLVGVPKFLPEYIKLVKHFDQDVLSVKEKEEIVYYQFFDEIKGFVNVKRGHGLGLRYGTSAIACCHLAHYMGASVIYLVGFDCTLGLLEYEGKGLSKIPHFYDRRNHKGEIAVSWNKQMGYFADWAKDHRTYIYNLSIPTMCDTVPRIYYGDIWSPE